jgi:hypothetical protein
VLEMAEAWQPGPEAAAFHRQWIDRLVAGLKK